MPSRPIANAGQQQIVGANSQVTLDASKSVDKDGTIVSYLWTQVKGPKVLLAHPNNIKSIFLPPAVDKDTVLVFRLVVKDNSGFIDFDTVGVKILRKVDNSLRQENNTARIQTETTILLQIMESKCEILPELGLDGKEIFLNEKNLKLSCLKKIQYLLTG